MVVALEHAAQFLHHVVDVGVVQQVVPRADQEVAMRAQHRLQAAHPSA